jgi:tRNA1(Val) A37 N6-methylase TrmN6
MSDFKGWTPPGPIPPGARDLPEVPPEETLDFISGHFRIFQLRDGHRFSTDDVLAAWYATTWCPSAATVLDLGSGIGSLALIAAWRLPGARLVTIEAQEMSVALARKSVAFNGLTDRVDLRCADLRDPTALAPDEHFDLVMGSPPYFPVGSGIEGDHPQKIACRFELRGDINDYCAVAVRHLAPGGVFACVFPEPDGQHERLLEAARATGLAIVRQRPVVLREGAPPLLGLYAMTRASDLPEAVRGQTWVEPDLVIRRANGAVHPEYQAIKLAFGFPP